MAANDVLHDTLMREGGTFDLSVASVAGSVVLAALGRITFSRKATAGPNAELPLPHVAPRRKLTRYFNIAIGSHIRWFVGTNRTASRRTVQKTTKELPNVWI